MSSFLVSVLKTVEVMTPKKGGMEVVVTTATDSEAALTSGFFVVAALVAFTSGATVVVVEALVALTSGATLVVVEALAALTSGATVVMVEALMALTSGALDSLVALTSEAIDEEALVVLTSTKEDPIESSFVIFCVDIKTETELETIVDIAVVTAQVFTVVVAVHITTCFIFVTFGFAGGASSGAAAGADGAALLEAQRGLSSAIESPGANPTTPFIIKMSPLNTIDPLSSFILSCRVGI